MDLRETSKNKILCLLIGFELVNNSSIVYLKSGNSRFSRLAGFWNNHQQLPIIYCHCCENTMIVSLFASGVLNLSHSSFCFEKYITRLESCKIYIEGFSKFWYLQLYIEVLFVPDDKMFCKYFPWKQHLGSSWILFDF